MQAVTPQFNPRLLPSAVKPSDSCCCMKVIGAVAKFFKDMIVAIYSFILSIFDKSSLKRNESQSIRVLIPQHLSEKAISLQRLVEIRNRTSPHAQCPISFSPSVLISHFDLDQHLEPFSKTSNVSNMIEIFDHAERDMQNDDYLYKRDKLIAIFAKYPRNKFQENPKKFSARQSLSQLYHIWLQKGEKVTAGAYNEEEFKEEIRKQSQEIIDAHAQCVDLVNSDLENILLDALMSELDKKNNLSKSQILAAHALFKFRSNLIKEICVQQNPYETLVPELERIVKKRLANEVGLKSRLTTTGAYYDYKILDVDHKVAKARAEYVKRYNKVPVRYLQTELQTYHGDKSLRKLRNEIMQQVMTNLDLANAYNDDSEVKDPDAKAIIEIASKEGEDGFLMGQSWSTAGVLWIMERAKLIHEDRA